MVTLYHGSFRVGRLFTWWLRALKYVHPKKEKARQQLSSVFYSEAITKVYSGSNRGDADST